MLQAAGAAEAGISGQRHGTRKDEQTWFNLNWFLVLDQKSATKNAGKPDRPQIIKQSHQRLCFIRRKGK